MFSRLLRGAVVGMGSLAIQAGSATAGLVALAATAVVIPLPAVFLAAGLGVHVGASAGLVGLVVRRQSTGRRKRVWLIATAALTLLSISWFTVGLLRPVNDPPSSANDVTGMHWWRLDEGARIAFTHTSPLGPVRPDPVVFLHGGPGVADLAGDTDYFGRLAEDGYEVYVYDQLGTGHSSRLENPGGYTLDRWVSDLEEIRRLIDADRMILIGHSWGTRIATRYLEQHPGRVSQLILSSPGALPGSDDDSGAGLVDSLPEGDRKRVLSLITHPRILVSYGLLQISPEASQNFTPDAEMDGRFDRVYNVSRPAFHCSDLGSGPELGGLGFYAYQFPQSASAPIDPDIRHEVSDQIVPTLTIKGQCDYLSWTSAMEYVEALSDTTLVYLEDAGHNAYQDRPNAYLEAVRSFLRGDDIPGERHDHSLPDSYQGPP